MTSATTASGRRVAGTLRVPGDKSVSHRALLFAALATGRSRVRHILNSADVRSTAAALRALGVATPEGPLPEDFVIQGVGLRGLRVSSGALDCGNSGTTTRLVAGIAAGYPFRTRFVGDASLSRRPMRRIGEPLVAMGASVTYERADGLPMDVTGGPLQAIRWVNATASAQVKSAILLAGLVGGVPVVIEAPHGSRDHTERFLTALGAGVRVADGGREVVLTPAPALASFDLDVPADPSSAAFFGALAATADSGTLRLPGVLHAPSRSGFFRVLSQMGGRVETEERSVTASGEETVTYVVGPGITRGVSVGADLVPSLIDELPLLACVAARAAPGEETVVMGATELRYKESDRIAATVANLRAIGVMADEHADGFSVVGGGRRPLRGRISTHGDHRLAMAFGILGALDGNAIEIDDPACVGVSYPDFWADLRRVAA